MHLAIQIQNLQSFYNLSNENTISYNNFFFISKTIPKNTEFDLKDSILKEGKKIKNSKKETQNCYLQHLNNFQVIILSQKKKIHNLFLYN